ncbi:S9 family peptidase [Siphonobacter sp. SORGH_AS_1065]|uniref:alpha/beta hydrolase family protein n=1 Tax=Siphonobacter sp. SORGH_AS_1065 TaxID=3041795 RepID=UPI00278A69AF|nr:alpha/beta fold hydrolase [Siphonobacter sp. SORGH_AS_1065]MDQ1090564.1 dienelactone hydrolase [Siphonobacter sp. SORGH_AS_1065]
MKNWMIGLLLIAGTMRSALAQPVRSDSVSYTKNGITYGGTLSYPNQKGLVPAVILVSGTGPQDRDGTMGKFRFFADLAQYLNTRGIAVLRVDDRGVGKTSGNYNQSTTEDFAQDAEAGIDFLKMQPKVDPQKIGLIGHSEGGAVISIIGSRRRDVAFLVSMAGLGRKGLDALLKQNADLVAAAPIPEHDKKRYNEINGLMFQTVYANVNRDSLGLAKAIQQTYDTWKKKDDELVKSLGIEHDHFRFPIYSYTVQATGPWYRYHIQYDPAQFLPNVQAPFLAINGDKDIYVSAQENLDNFKRLLQQGGNKDVTVKVFPGLNHQFLACQQCTPSEFASLKKQFPADVLSTIGDWIVAHTTSKKD